MILMGDWNVDVSPWIDPITPLTEYQKLRAPLLTSLREMASANGLELQVTEQTRKQGICNASTLDVVLTNQPKAIRKTTLLPSSSDHLILMVEKVTKVKLETPEPFQIRSFKNYTKENICQTLDLGLLDSLLDLSDTELVANVLIGHISEAIERIAPLKMIQPRAQYVPYLSKETKSKMANRDKLRWEALKTGNEEDMKEYKKMKNSTLKQQRSDKKKWVKKVMGEDLGDSKRIWSTVQKITRMKKSNTLDKLVIDGIITKEKKLMANGLNKFFITKVANLVAEMPIPAAVLLDELRAQEPLNIPELSLLELSSQSLDILIGKVKRSPAAGLDNISGIILQDVYACIKPSLLHLINLSMATGIYPSIFKLTKIIPTLKQGKDPSHLSSYRPVSNISVVGKLIERAVMDQLNGHIST